MQTVAVFIWFEQYVIETSSEELFGTLSENGGTAP